MDAEWVSEEVQTGSRVGLEWLQSGCRVDHVGPRMGPGCRVGPE